jgi:hypothetical protein
MQTLVQMERVVEVHQELAEMVQVLVVLDGKAMEALDLTPTTPDVQDL